MVPGAGIEPARSVRARDFKSLVSTYFTIRAAVTLRNAAIMSGHAYWIRTSGPQLRRLLLYPTELRRDIMLHCLVGPP